MFKDSFKYYKSKTDPPDLSTVIDFDKPHDPLLAKKLPINVRNEPFFHRSDCLPPEQWEVYELHNRPGLIFIRNPFTAHGQRYWMARCLRDYPKAPHAVNLTNIRTIPIESTADWWSTLQSTPQGPKHKHLQAAMRWATLGYHHDWDTKVYSEKMRHPFPADLAELSRYIADVLNIQTQYSAEAAIVNFYPMGTTLAGHTDHSEQNLDAPLFSLSFGQTAVFLIGGPTIDEKPSALFLRSGDIVVMSKASRLSYHAVPRIVTSDVTSNWRLENDCVDDEHVSKPKRRKLTNEMILIATKLDDSLWTETLDDCFWKPFDRYVNECRININVRQVLRNGQNSLDDVPKIDANKCFV